MLSYVEKYKAHLTIAGLVFLSFAISGFKFDIAQSSALTKVIYGFVQVFSLTLCLALSKELMTQRFNIKLNHVVLTSIVVIIGTTLSFLLDYPIMRVFQLIDPNCLFEKSEAPLYVDFLQDLKYPVVFWPLCELADFYLLKLTQVSQQGVSAFNFEDLPFLKSVPRSQRKDILAIEAQQNYIQLIYYDKNYTVLYRLKDALNDIPQEIGMKVHRSYWVAFKGIEKIKNSTSLVLRNGKEIPISRSFSKELKERF